MQKLVWSDELARIAQTWADQCDCVFQQNQVQIIRLGRDKNDCVFQVYPSQVYPCFHEPTGGRDRSPAAGRCCHSIFASIYIFLPLNIWLSVEIEYQRFGNRVQWPT